MEVHQYFTQHPEITWLLKVYVPSAKGVLRYLVIYMLLALDSTSTAKEAKNTFFIAFPSACLWDDFFRCSSSAGPKDLMI